MVANPQDETPPIPSPEVPNDALRQWYFDRAELLDPEPVRFDVRLRVWRLPSRDTWRHWVVLEPRTSPGDTAAWLVRMTTRKRSAAPSEGERASRVASLIADRHSLGLHEVRVGLESLRPLLSSLAALSLPIRAERTLGLDGIRSGVEIRNELTEGRFSWWGRGPKEWKSMIGWHDSAVELLGGLFNRNCPLPE